MPSSDKTQLALGIDQYTEAIISVLFGELESNTLSRLYKAC